MIGDGEKYNYLAVTNLSGLIQGNSSNDWDWNEIMRFLLFKLL